MIKSFLGVAMLLAFFLPTLAQAQAQGLSADQISAITQLLQTFGADQEVILNVQDSLDGSASTGSPVAPVSTGAGSPTAPAAAPPAAAMAPSIVVTGSSVTSSLPSAAAVPAGTVSANGAPTSVTPPVTACLSLERNLFVYATDATTNGEVSKLQKFLGGRVTGYFGPATLQLVKNWQSSQGIVTSGSPTTTGYGYVGPKTRASFACSTSVSSTSNGIPSNAAAVANPVSGVGTAINPVTGTSVINPPAVPMTQPLMGTTTAPAVKVPAPFPLPPVAVVPSSPIAATGTAATSIISTTGSPATSSSFITSTPPPTTRTAPIY